MAYYSMLENLALCFRLRVDNTVLHKATTNKVFLCSFLSLSRKLEAMAEEKEEEKADEEKGDGDGSNAGAFKEAGEEEPDELPR